MMVRKILLATALVAASAAAAQAADPESCKTVRFSDVGWTDITATTSVASTLLKGLGYEPQVELLSVPSGASLPRATTIAPAPTCRKAQNTRWQSRSMSMTPA